MTSVFASVISVVALFSAVVLLGFAAPARAQMAQGPNFGYKVEPGQTSSTLPKALREIGFDQNLGKDVPLDIPFTDESGKAVRLGDFFGSKPVVLALVYYECPMLCTQVLNGLSAALDVLSLDAGKDFEVVAVSFNPRETPQLAAAKKATYLQRYHRPGTEQGWHFLTGEEANIERLTKAVGFRYAWDEKIKQYAHPTGVTVLTPQGRLSRYLYGVEYGPRDLRLSLVDASSGKVGTPVDQLLLYCYHYDPETGKYGLVVMGLMRIAGAATVLLLGAFIVVMVRRDKRH